jgi:nuclear transcription factor Y alpha
MGDPVDQLLEPAYHLNHYAAGHPPSSSSAFSRPHSSHHDIYNHHFYHNSRNPSPGPSSPTHTTHRNSPVDDIFLHHHIHPPTDQDPHSTSTDDHQVDEEPLYVNAKQYFRILKRRVARARLDEVHRLSRQRKVLSALFPSISHQFTLIQPYLHESRHKHAMRRPRGPGGRFLTAEEIAAQKSAQAASSTVLHDADDDDPDDHPAGMSLGKEDHDTPPATLINTPVRDEPALQQHINPYSQPFSTQQVHHPFQDSANSTSHVSTPVTTQLPPLSANPQPPSLMPHAQHTAKAPAASSGSVTLRPPYTPTQMHHVPHPHAHARHHHSHLNYSEGLYPTEEAPSGSGMLSYGTRNLDTSGR